MLFVVIILAQPLTCMHINVFISSHVFENFVGDICKALTNFSLKFKDIVLIFDKCKFRT